MRTKLYLILLATFLLLPLGLVKAETVKTDTSASSQFTVTPAVYEHVLEQGKASSQAFQLTNKSQLPLPIKSYVRAFEASDDMGGVDIKEEPDIQRLAPTSWVSVETPDFIIQPDSTLKVNVNFNPPVDLPPGGYYAVVFFEPQLPESFIKDNNSLQINGRVGALLFLVGAGDIQEKGEIASFSTKMWNWGNKAINFKSDFKNSGNVHLRPSGTLTVKNLIPFLGREEKSDIKEVTVLPGKTRELALVSNKYRWPGIYNAKISLNYGRENKTINKEITFVFIPWKYLLSLAVIVMIIIFLSKRRNRRRLAKAAKIIEGGQ